MPDISSDKISDIGMKFYESARNELIQRIVLRDGALLFYVTAVGSYLSYCITSHFGVDIKNVEPEFEKLILLTIPLPLVCLIFSLIVIQHHLMIGYLGCYIKKELNIGQMTNSYISDWDNSSAQKRSIGRSLGFRLVAQAIILIAPIGYELIFYIKYNDIARNLYWLYLDIMKINLILSLVIAAYIVWLHWKVHIERKEIA